MSRPLLLESTPDSVLTTSRNPFAGLFAKVAVLVPLLLAPAMVHAAPELGTSQSAIVSGNTDVDDPAVVAILHNGSQFCTGILITPIHVLTAAHCAYPNTNFPFSEMEAFFGAEVDGEGTTIAVVDGLAHPDWKETALPNDIAVLSLSEEAPVDPVAVPGLIFEKANITADTARMIGFGIIGKAKGGNGIKRDGVMDLVRVDASTLYLSTSDEATCNGDSGGPLMLVQGDREVLWGIHSRSNCETDAMNERIDVHLFNFVEPYVAAEGYQLINSDAVCESDGVCNPDCALDIDCDSVSLPVYASAGCSSSGNDGLMSFLLLCSFLGLVLRGRRAGFGRRNRRK